MNARDNQGHLRFRISARTIIQLGRELISSDGVAFFELIKNAFDAGSSEVRVEVISRLPFDALEQARERLKPTDGELPDQKQISLIVSELEEQLIVEAPGAEAFARGLANADTAEELQRQLDWANEIRFEDSGHGMSLKDLSDIYLRVGTPSKILERRSDPSRVILGEKGIGRLSVMRLGSILSVKTSRDGEAHWAQLNIDWRDFERNIGEYVEEIPVELVEGDRKPRRDASGTVITIAAVRADWTEEKLRQVVTNDLSRVLDPFADVRPVSIRLRYNDAPIRIEEMSELLFKHAHAVVTGVLEWPSADRPCLTTHVEYRLRGRSQDFRLQRNDLYEAAGDVKPHVIDRLGRFSVRLYWFNRGILDPIEGIGTVTQVKRLIARWSGGLMVYRDGFRVPPYGGADDDWLDLDRAAFGSGGYKLNREQLIGKVDITSHDNPLLVDQTNREGLIDCPEKAALESLLRKILLKQFKPFVQQVDEEESLKRAPTIKQLGERFEGEEKELRKNISALRRVAGEHPDAGLAPLVTRLARQATKIRGILRNANEAQQGVDRRKDQLLDLAGLGLMAEILAHELNRSVVHALKGLSTALSASREKRLTSLLRSAEAQLKSLQKRVTVLDSLSTTGRQRTQTFDVSDAAREVLDGRSEQFERHGIAATIVTTPESSSLSVRMVKGMFYQIIENLIENSVYWFRSERKLNPGFKAAISLSVDATSGALYYSDNGPGIDPLNADQIFVPFFSLKKKGKGLGLFVSREYARDQGTDLTLSKTPARKDGRLNTFILNLSGAAKG